MSSPVVDKAMRLAVEHHEAGRLPSAAAIYRKILEIEPDNARAMHFLGVISHQIGRADIALQLIQRSIALEGDRAEYYQNLGNLYFKLHGYDDAAAAFREVIRLEPTHVAGHLHLGVTLAKQGKAKEGAQHQRRARELSGQIAPRSVPPKPQTARPAPVAPPTPPEPVAPAPIPEPVESAPAYAPEPVAEAEPTPLPVEPILVEEPIREMAPIPVFGVEEEPVAPSYEAPQPVEVQEPEYAAVPQEPEPLPLDEAVEEPLPLEPVPVEPEVSGAEAEDLGGFVGAAHEPAEPEPLPLAEAEEPLELEPLDVSDPEESPPALVREITSIVDAPLDEAPVEPMRVELSPDVEVEPLPLPLDEPHAVLREEPVPSSFDSGANGQAADHAADEQDIGFDAPRITGVEAAAEAIAPDFDSLGIDPAAAAPLEVSSLNAEPAAVASAPDPSADVHAEENAVLFGVVPIDSEEPQPSTAADDELPQSAPSAPSAPFEPFEPFEPAPAPAAAATTSVAPEPSAPAWPSFGGSMLQLGPMQLTPRAGGHVAGSISAAPAADSATTAIAEADALAPTPEPAPEAAGGAFAGLAEPASRVIPNDELFTGLGAPPEPAPPTFAPDPDLDLPLEGTATIGASPWLRPAAEDRDEPIWLDWSDLVNPEEAARYRAAETEAHDQAAPPTVSTEPAPVSFHATFSQTPTEVAPERAAEIAASEPAPVEPPTPEPTMTATTELAAEPVEALVVPQTVSEPEPLAAAYEPAIPSPSADVENGSELDWLDTSEPAAEPAAEIPEPLAGEPPHVEDEAPVAVVSPDVVIPEPTDVVAEEAITAVEPAQEIEPAAEPQEIAFNAAPPVASDELELEPIELAEAPATAETEAAKVEWHAVEPEPYDLGPPEVEVVRSSLVAHDEDNLIPLAPEPDEPVPLELTTAEEELSDTSEPDGEGFEENGGSLLEVEADLGGPEVDATAQQGEAGEPLTASDDEADDQNDVDGTSVHVAAIPAVDDQPISPDAPPDLAIIRKRRDERREKRRQRRAKTAGTDMHRMAHQLLRQRRMDEAIQLFARLVEQNPGSAKAHRDLGAAYLRADRLEDSITELQRALQLRPKFADAFGSLGDAYHLQGRLDDAIACYQKVLQLRPGAAKVHSNLLLTLNYHHKFDSAALFAEHVRWAELHATPLAGEIRPHANDPDPERPLKVGYVSPDFRQHSVNYFVEPILAAHNRLGFSVVGYSDAIKPDAVTEQIAARCESWRDIRGMGDEEVAELIRNDGIDVLVDLAGHTGTNRMGVFARKPAPVQVSYLGYPNTTGLPTMDYRLTDAVADPLGTSEQFHAERLLRLPGTFLCYQPPPEAPEVQTPPSQRGLSRGTVTFGCFNILAKITPEVMAAWARILAAVPESRLILKGRMGSLAYGSRRRYVTDIFAYHGINPKRLDLLGKEPSFARHLEMYREVDIALDPWPYNGTTTTCEALWMGVPVISLSGNRHASRVGTSVLSALSLKELVASTPEQYQRIAVGLANNPSRLSFLRNSLRERMRRSPLMDGRTFTRGLEDAYRQMWTRWCERQRAGGGHSAIAGGGDEDIIVPVQ